MKPPPDKLLPLLTAAAELKAAGASWAAVAAGVGRSPETVRRWPALYPHAWRRLLHDAERQLLTEVAAESVTTLRKMLRSEDEKVRRDAARILLTARNRTKSSDDGDAPAVDDECLRIAAYLAQFNDDQVTDITDELIASITTGERRPAPAPGGDGGPA
jgi:hypothetical protein